MPGPLYRQIADQLRRMIETGGLKAGMQVPTEDQLMEEFSLLVTRSVVPSRSWRHEAWLIPAMVGARSYPRR